MKQAPARSQAPAVVMESEVARRIRQHARSSPKAEVCGVLIGREDGNTTFVDACIQGVNAAQGGAHVTFTQETWEHIYNIKDKEFPEERIVGWYHSHPGFGVFLSDHDLFIQQNFFSSPQQVAWVYDPHSDEEGCFGWLNKTIEKLDDVRFQYVAALGEIRDNVDDEPIRETPRGRGDDVDRGWFDHAFTVLSYLITLLAGAALMFFYIRPNKLAEAAFRAGAQEGLKQSLVRDCGRFLFPQLPPPQQAPPQEKPNVSK